MLVRIFLLALLLCSGPVWALDSDADQPATLEANDFEIDLKSGQRIYRGDVVYRQGSIRLDCDELVTVFNDDGELDKAICTGDPGKFKQRPEGEDSDMVGKAREITMDQVDELVIMKSRADVKQGTLHLTGRLITYDMSTEKVVVKGDKASGKKSTIATDTESAATDSTETTEVEPSSSRAKLVIQPRKKKKKN